jgi:dienelactone hydrolase
LLSVWEKKQVRPLNFSSKSIFFALVAAVNLVAFPAIHLSTQAASVLTASQDQYLIKPKSVKKEVSFQTEDGWRIFGTLTLPEGLSEGRRLPAALLVHGGEHDQSVFDTYPGWVKIQESITTLRIDLRGRGKSRGRLESHNFTSEQREHIYLDVKGALALLETQANVDPQRIAIVAEESSADAAVLGAAGDPNVKVMAFLSGRLGERAMSYIAANDQIALLAVVSQEDRASFADMTAVYSRSKNHASEIMIFDNLGVGAAMGSVWRDKFPNQKPIDFTLGEWVVSRLSELGEVSEVVFQTQDGYTLHADLILPAGSSPERKAPGAILLHSALGDRSIFQSLGRALAKAGIATLSIDWRGRGQSIEKGYYFDLPKAEREKVPLDVRAAADFLAAQKAVDGSRIGIVGLVLSAKYGMIAAASDARVKTFVVMTGFIPGDAEKQSIANLKVPVLYLLSEGRPRVTKAMMDHYALTKSYGSQVFSYEGGAHGFHLLEMDKRWEPMIVGWLADHLSSQ